MLEAQYSVTLTYPDALTQCWAPSWLSNPVVSPETPAIPDETTPDEAETYFPDAADPAEFDENEFFWEQIPDRDLVYLVAPRKYPDPCPWCGGRTKHNPTCDELRGSWEIAMPFGKWKGKPISQVPADYLMWLVANSESLDIELREAIQGRLSA